MSFLGLAKAKEKETTWPTAKLPRLAHIDVYKSAAKASQRLGLENTPTYRVEFEILNNPRLLRNGTKVQPLNGLPGKGAEFMTTDPVKVRLINSQPLR